MSVKILVGDVREMLKTLPDNSVDVVVTSPPYFGLRDYGIDGQIGLEASLGEHLKVMVEVFREVRRVMKPTATLWLNYGDTYASSVNGRSAADTKAAGNDDRTFRDKPFSTVGPIYVPDPPGEDRRGDSSTINTKQPLSTSGRVAAGGYMKPKDLCLVPHRVAIALWEDGWWVRQDIVWAKPNPMPESISDRCTKSHEYIFLMAKAERYFFDQEAILEPISEGTHLRVSQANLENQYGSDRVPGKTNGPMEAVLRDVGVGAGARPRKAVPNGAGQVKNNLSFDAAMVAPGRKSGNLERKPRPGTPEDGDGNLAGSIPWEGYRRNKRSVWTVTTQPFKEAHFATFPTALIEPCILAGTSAHGNCAKCGKPWERETERVTMESASPEISNDRKALANDIHSRHRSSIPGGQSLVSGFDKTTGWQPTCKCGTDEVVPAVVLDPFGGAGTTGLVADRLGRDAILIELNPAYADIARRRITGDSPLFAEVK